MIRKDKGLRKICRNYHLVENYEKAIADEEQLWILHHRREIDEMKSMQQLKDEGKYFDVEPSELIFLSISEHAILHGENKLKETRNKLSKALSGEKNPNYGKHYSEEARKKLSETLKGRQISEETRKKMSESCRGEKNQAFGKHW